LLDCVGAFLSGSHFAFTCGVATLARGHAPRPAPLGTGQFRGHQLCRELQLTTPRDPLLRWIPANKVAYILPVQYRAAGLKQCIRALLAPAHVTVALRPLPDDIVDRRFGAGPRDGPLLCVTALVVDEQVGTVGQVSDQIPERVLRPNSAGTASQRLETLQATVVLAVPEQLVEARHANDHRSSTCRRLRQHWPSSTCRHLSRADHEPTWPVVGREQGTAGSPERVNGFATPGDTKLVCGRQGHCSAFSPRAAG
jgi:hypothetical protein